MHSKPWSRHVSAGTSVSGTVPPTNSRKNWEGMIKACTHLLGVTGRRWTNASSLQGLITKPLSGTPMSKTKSSCFVDTIIHLLAWNAFLILLKSSQLIPLAWSRSGTWGTSSVCKLSTLPPMNSPPFLWPTLLVGLSPWRNVSSAEERNSVTLSMISLRTNCSLMKNLACR